MGQQIPSATGGSIGGSGTMGARFPEDYDRAEVAVLEYFDGFETPYGRTGALFKLLEIDGTRILRVANHGWFRDETGHVVPILQTAPQIAWVFGQAGIDWAIVDGTAGGIANPETDARSDPPAPWSAVVPHDFIQHWMAPHSLWDPGEAFHRVAEPMCADLRRVLVECALREPRFVATFDRGVYVSAPPGRLETVAEIQMMAGWGAHLVGQTLGMEAPLMRQRDIPIHFAGIYLISNFAEGIRSDQWVGESDDPTSYAEFYRACALPFGYVLLDAIRKVIRAGIGPCNCRSYGFSGFDIFPAEGA